MKDISSLLERISKSLGRSTLLKESIASIIKEKIGADISTDDISYKDGVLELVASPALKSELRLREESIKALVRERTGNTVARVLYK